MLEFNQRLFASTLIVMIIGFCSTGCNSKTQPDLLINPTVEISGSPNQLVYLSCDQIEYLVSSNGFSESWSGDNGTRKLDDQGKFTLKVEGDAHGLNVTIVSLDSNSVDVVVNADNADAVKGTVSGKLKHTNLLLGHEQIAKPGEVMYADPLDSVSRAEKYLISQEKQNQEQADPANGQ